MKKGILFDLDGTLWDSSAECTGAWNYALRTHTDRSEQFTLDDMHRFMGKPMDEIAAGIQMAVAKRCFVMAKKAGATDSITLTGGCAKNAGLKQAIERVLKLKVIDLKTDPQLMGALGAAEYARQKGLAKA